MTAETLRKAAALMRERAEVARAGRWYAHAGEEAAEVYAHWREPRFVALCDGSLPEGNAANAEHIASWRPAAALAVADWLDEAADHLEVDTSDRSLTNICPTAFEGEDCSVIGQALAVARAYLGEQP